MKKKIMIIIAVAMCAAFITAGIGTVSYAARGGEDGEAVANDTAKEEASIDAGDEAETAADAQVKAAASGNADGTLAVLKDETVYVIADADGSSRKVIVSDWLKNDAGKAQVEDETDLGDIEVVKGDTTCKTAGSSRTWDANGSDVYYQGRTDKALPVDVKISYELDGRSIQPGDLEGKSGRLKIRFDYENREYEEVAIDGQQEKIYVPFAMLTGMVLDNDVFTNIELTNGEQVNDGDRTIVTGIALPGLKTDLAIEKDIIEIPESFEITADVEGYKQPMTMIVASGDLFGKIKTDKLDDLDGLGDALSELEDGAKQLVDGSSDLYDGLATLLEKSGDLADGIDALANGASTLKDGAAALDDGAGKLADGADKLSNGLDTLTGNNEALRQAAGQVYTTLLATADKELREAGIDVPALTCDNYEKVLGDLIASLDEKAVYEQAEKAVRAAVEANRDQITALVTAAVREEVAKEVQAAVEQQTQGTVTGDALQAMVDTYTEAKMGSDEVKELIEVKTQSQIDGLVAQNLQSDEVQAKLSAAGEGAKKIITLKTSIDGFNAFYNGLVSYTDGVAQAAEGAKSLKSGCDELKTGADALADGAGKLEEGLKTVQEGMPVLLDGILKLKNGAGELSDGMKKFYEQGIEKLVEAVDGDIEGLAERLKAVRNVSEHYNNFSGLGEGMEGTVKFIYRIGE